MPDAAEPRDPAPVQINAQKAVVIQHQNVAGDSSIGMGTGAQAGIPVHTPPRHLPPRDAGFAGREAELAELHTELTADSQVGITQQRAMHGHGGIGKTSTAIEYAWRYLDSYPGGAFYLPCDSDLPPAVADLAPHLGIGRSETSDDMAARVRQHLETGPPCLLVLDNVRSADQWKDAAWNRHLPAGSCRRLITTRAEHLPAVRMYPLDRLSPEDGVLLLAEFRPDAHDDAGAARVVEWFGGLAVGLTVVGSYMQDHPNLRWDRYADSLDRKGLDAVRATENAVDSRRSYERRVDSVFDDLLDSLPAAERRALEYAALLPEDNVYRAWLRELLAGDDQVQIPDLPGYEGEGAEQVVAKLVARKLLRELGENGSLLAVHRLLRHRLRERLSPVARESLIDPICTLAEARGIASHNWLDDRSLRGELGPLGALAAQLAKLGRLESAASLANWITTPLRGLGRYAEIRAVLEPLADELGEGAISVSEIGILLSHLAMVLQDVGELSQARERMERAIEIAERIFHPNHPMLATRYSNLAMILKNVGQLSQARGWMDRAIAIDERNFELNHPTLATRYSNLATILKDMGELPQARERMERAIEIEEQNFDPNHPTLATSYSNLATILHAMGELPQARERIERAIEIKERIFDPNHPTLATSYANLASICLSEGRRDEACSLLKQAEAIAAKHFATTHPISRAISAGMSVACKPAG
ncbi:MAG TPA: tetratricopeptide repeat protein [Longimicrobiaceae bacterium]|nr:tetratricopeptide repeat protein [Longimicrobiaceae bacterium]